MHISFSTFSSLDNQKLRFFGKNRKADHTFLEWIPRTLMFCVFFSGIPCPSLLLGLIREISLFRLGVSSYSWVCPVEASLLSEWPQLLENLICVIICFLRGMRLQLTELRPSRALFVITAESSVVVEIAICDTSTSA